MKGFQTVAGAGSSDSIRVINVQTGVIAHLMELRSAFYRYRLHFKTDLCNGETCVHLITSFCIMFLYALKEWLYLANTMDIVSCHREETIYLSVYRRKNSRF